MIAKVEARATEMDSIFPGFVLVMSARCETAAWQRSASYPKRLGQQAWQHPSPMDRCSSRRGRKNIKQS